MAESFPAWKSCKLENSVCNLRNKHLYDSRMIHLFCGPLRLFFEGPPRTDCGLSCSADPEPTVLFPKGLVWPLCLIMDLHLSISYNKDCITSATETVHGIYSLFLYPKACGSGENGLLCRWQPAPGHPLGPKGADRFSLIHCMGIHGRVPVEKEETNLLGCLQRLMISYSLKSPKMDSWLLVVVSLGRSAETPHMTVLLNSYNLAGPRSCVTTPVLHNSLLLVYFDCTVSIS